jgi:YebC/PmpR family DNA-binding regulatory protein
MGRIFEKRKYKMFARWAKMSKAFTKLGREIAIAVKQGGPDSNSNPRLRMAIQTAKSVNMPKDRVDGAIKRAISKEHNENYQEVTYEGYGPHGIAIMVDCATDNPTRTVANLRVYFSRNGGSLGHSGALAFMFDRKGVFKVNAENVNVEELELELIDFGADEFFVEENNIFVYTQFTDFGHMQKALEERKLHVISAELQRIPHTTTELSEEQEAEVLALIDKLEEDDDVQAVFHNMR